MKNLFGVVFIAGGIILGFYLGIWVLFIGGIVDVIGQIQAPVLEAKGLAIGIAKVLFAGFIGTVVGGIFIFIGKAILDD